MVDVDEAQDLPKCGPVTPQLIGTDRVWDIIIAKSLGQKGSRPLGVEVSLEQAALHEAVLVHRPPEPMANTSTVVQTVQTSARSHREPRRGSR